MLLRRTVLDFSVLSLYKSIC